MSQNEQGVLAIRVAPNPLGGVTRCDNRLCCVYKADKDQENLEKWVAPQQVVVMQNQPVCIHISDGKMCSYLCSSFFLALIRDPG